MRDACASLLVMFAATFPTVALANGLRPVRATFAVDITCARGEARTIVRNARVEGIEPGKRVGALRVAASGAAPELLALHAIERLRLEPTHKVNAKGFAAAQLRRAGSGAEERVQIQVRTAAGPVRLVSFGAPTAVELNSCDRIMVERRPDAAAPSRGALPKR
jgi:hypothetical protein